MLRVCVCVQVLVIRRAKRTFPMQHYVFVCGLPGCTAFFNIIT